MDTIDFKKLVIPLCGRLYHFAHMMLRDRAEAEDAVQEVCLKLWKIRESLEQYNSLEAFAIKVTRNWCLDRLKAKKPVYIETYHTWIDKGSGEDDPHQTLEFNDRLNRLYAILNKLPEQQRLIVQLREIEGLDYTAIEEIMDMNINAVRVNLSRARQKIREEMLKYESDGYQSDQLFTGKIL
jgi:RNA polymerase sigma factor (sigma-70 family)